MDQVTIGYWDQRGLVEPIRLTLEICSLPYKFDKIENTKEGTQKWQHIKPQLQKSNPFINLPYLLDGDNVISESSAIIDYIIYKANRTELFGTTPQSRVWCQTILSFVREFNWNLILVSYDPEYSSKIQNELQTVKSKLNILEQHLSNNSWNYLAGNTETIADLVCYEALQHVLHHDHSLLNQFQRLQLLIKNVESIEQIKQYLKSERFQKHPFNSPLRATKA